MKYLLLLTYTFCFVLVADAQQSSLKFPSGTKGKANATQSRLIATSSKITRFSYSTDSSSLFYGPGMGEYDDKLQSWNFDTTRSIHSENGFTQRKFIAKEYNAAKQCVHELWVDSLDNNPTIVFDKSIAYDNAGNIIRYDYEATPYIPNKDRYEYNYNAGQLQTEISTYTTDGVTWLNDMRHRYNYDANGVLQNIYHDRGTSIGWYTHNRTSYIYNGSNIAEQIYEIYINYWDTSYRITYNYDIAGRKISQQMYNYDWVAHTWDTADRERYVYDNTGKLQTIFYDRWGNGTYQNTDRIDNTYNNHDQILTSISSYSEAHYYYEEYNTGVNNVAAQQAFLNVYPSPASGILNISLNTNKPSVASFTISDATGKVIQNWSGYADNNYSKRINTSDLAAGTYIINMRTGAEMQARKFIVAR